MTYQLATTIQTATSSIYADSSEIESIWDEFMTEQNKVMCYANESGAAPYCEQMTNDQDFNHAFKIERDIWKQSYSLKNAYQNFLIRNNYSPSKIQNERLAVIIQEIEDILCTHIKFELSIDEDIILSKKDKEAFHYLIIDKEEVEPVYAYSKINGNHYTKSFANSIDGIINSGNYFAII